MAVFAHDPVMSDLVNDEGNGMKTIWTVIAALIVIVVVLQWWR